MICEMCKPLLSEYTDGRLNAERRDQVQAHLTQCADCAALVRDFGALGGLLRGLPVSQTSPQFEARLAERLAQAGSPPQQAPWLRRLGALLRPQPLLWRPALALGAAAAAIAGMIAFQHPNPPMEPLPLPEGALVTHCVQQHRSYVGAQPLSDIAAQSLANQLDESATTPSVPLSGENDL